MIFLGRGSGTFEYDWVIEEVWPENEVLVRCLERGNIEYVCRSKD
jgi:hypothetical protein